MINVYDFRGLMMMASVVVLDCNFEFHCLKETFDPRFTKRRDLQKCESAKSVSVIY